MNLPVASFDNTPAKSLYPRLRLKAGDILRLNEEEYFAQKRQGERWILVSLETEELRIESDARLVELRGLGQLNYRSRLQAQQPISPIAPVVLEADARADALRKHEYVLYVINRPDGYRCSKPWLSERIKEKAIELSDDNPPSPGSLINWKALHDALYHEIGLAAYAPRHDLKGKRGSRLLAPKKEALDRAVDRYLQAGTIKDAYVEAVKFIHDFNQSVEGKAYCQTVPLKHLDANGFLIPPSLSTLEREIREKVSPFVRRAGRIGPHYARKHGRTYQMRALPERPYAEVEVDFTPVDLVIVAENGAYLGRPHLIAFLDRATRMVVGMSISLDVPGYAAVLDGLRNATFQKRIEHIDGLHDEDWPCMGRIERLYIDNGKEFANGHLKAAAQELGFEIHRLPPREPWHKGLVERFMREVARFSHRFPGTTHSNAVQHRDFENPDGPVFTLEEFRDLTTKWIVTDYNRRPNRGLGDVPGVAKAPIHAWADKLDLIDCPNLPSQELFIALAGERTTRTVQKYGVEWDHILYWSPELDRILAHPDHASKSTATRSAQYEVHRDPYDLSQIYLYNHHAKETLVLPLVDKWREYATGLSVHQHRLCREHESIREDQRSDPDALWKARAALIETAMGALQSGKRKQLERKLTRFLYGNQTRPFVSTIQSQGVSAADTPMPLSPIVETTTLVLPEGTSSMQPTSISHVEVPVAQPDDPAAVDDLDEILRLATQVRSGSRIYG